jgi:hypothetical protein
MNHSFRLSGLDGQGDAKNPGGGNRNEGSRRRKVPEASPLISAKIGAIRSMGKLDIILTLHFFLFEFGFPD